MLHTVTKRLEICTDSNIEISLRDNHTWIFTSRIFRLALEINLLINKYFFLQMAYELRVIFEKKIIDGGRLLGTGE